MMYMGTANPDVCPRSPLQDLDPLAHCGAEMTGAFHQVALVQIIGPHANAHQVLHQAALQVDVVVDAG